MKQTVYLIFYGSKLLSIFPSPSDDLKSVWVSWLKHYRNPPEGDYSIALWDVAVPDRGAIDIIANVQLSCVKEEGDF